VPAFLQQNMQLNSVSFDYLECDWRQQQAIERKFDVIVASDVLYDADLPVDLARRISEILVPAGEFIVSDPGRAYLQDFATECERLGMVTQTHIHAVASAGFGSREIFVLSGKRPV
jgi:predicted nicotinamide N-methyase